MRIPRNLNWKLTPKEAVAQQRKLAEKLVARNEIGEVSHIGATDNAFEKSNTVSRAVVVVVSYPRLELVESQIAHMKVTFPYIPGLLSYRELPSLMEAFGQLTTKPDIILVDGHGYAHPRRFGIASYLGVLLDVPTVGCAKSILIGKAAEPANHVGAWTSLTHNGEVIGAAVRTKENVKPVFVSIGHRVDLKAAIEWVLNCTKGYRLPEPARIAHRMASLEKGRTD